MGGGWKGHYWILQKRKNKDKRMSTRFGFGNIGASWDPRRDPSRFSWSRKLANLLSCKLFLF